MLIIDPDNTRRLLLEAAFDKIRVHGFQAASLSNILAKTNVTKGALYHHFPDKKKLGYAVKRRRVVTQALKLGDLK